MLGSEILDVVIGLMLIYFLLSLVLSTLRELIESMIKSRGVLLERGIREMLKTDALIKDLYNHPMVSSLFLEPYETVQGRRTGRNLPSYIPSRNFAVALMDLVLRGPVPPMPVSAAPGSDAKALPPAGTPPASSLLTLSNLRTAADAIQVEPVRRAVIVAIDSARGDIARAQANIEAWFDTSMERVGGWYRRRTQWWLLAMSILVSIGLNVNTITLVNHLASNKAARDMLVQDAAGIHQPPTTPSTGTPSTATPSTGAAALSTLVALNIPFGWKGEFSHGDNPASHAAMREQPEFSLGEVMFGLPGLLITAIALTLGAPFWFDLLSKMMTVRSTTKPKASGK